MAEEVRYGSGTMPADATRPSLLIAVRDSANDGAWREFVGLYQPLVYQHAMGRGLQPADAADIAQEVLKAVSGAMNRFEYDRSKGTFRAWLLTVTRRKLANHFAARGRRGIQAGETTLLSLESEEPGPAEVAVWDREYEMRLIRWAMEQVKGEFQEATWLAFWRTAIEAQPVAQVGEELGLSAGAVYIARSRVMAKIRTRVTEVDEDEALSSLEAGN